MERSITVEGTGEASRAPDEARVTFTVLRMGESARAAVDATSQAMGSVIAGMRELGAGDRDLQTANLQISPQYSQEQPRPNEIQTGPEIIGYEARNTLTVVVRDIAKVGTVLDKAVELGVNQGGDIAFSLADETSLIDDARKAAVADARDRAALYAQAAGIELGQLMSIEEPGDDNGYRPKGEMRMMAASDAGSVPVEAGELTVSARIRLIYAIADGQ